MIRKAKAVWRGTGRAASGNLSTDSGLLAETPHSGFVSKTPAVYLLTARTTHLDR
jgi:hypothetical protein